MTEKRLLDELGERIAQAVRNTPVQDVEKNLRALLATLFDRFDLVPREDFEVQKKLLERAQTRLAVLEARVTELESRREPKSTE
jgi:BMFP domain-containing protein YqiC